MQAHFKFQVTIRLPGDIYSCVVFSVFILHSHSGGRKGLEFEPHIVFKLRKIGLNISVKKNKTFIPIKRGLCKCSQAALLFNSIRMNDAAACNHAVNRN